MISRWLVFLALCISCTSKETTRNPHQTSAGALGTQQYQSSCEQILLGTLTPLCNVDSLSTETAISLLFSPEIVYNPVVFFNDVLDPIFWQVNQNVLNEQNPQLVSSLVSRILTDCRMQETGSCKVFRRYSSINNTYDIFLKHLQSGTSIPAIEDFILLTDATLVNRSALALIGEIAKRAENLKKDERLISLVNTYLSVYEGQISSEHTKVLLRYVNRINGSYLNLLSKNELVEQLNQLHQHLPLNIFQKEQAVRPALAKALNLRSLARDPFFKLIDLVESQQLDISEAREILLKLSSESSIVDKVKMFMRWTFAYQLQTTNNTAKAIINGMNVGSNDLFERFQFDVDVIRRNWSAYKYQQQNLVTNISRANISASTKNMLRESTRSLDQTIKIHSEYPHMFYLATFLSQQDFSRTISIGTSRVPMSSNSIFNEIVNPLRTHLSWFKYTEDYFPLNDLLIRNSISYMFKSDFFASMGVHTEVFLSYFLKNLNSLYIERFHREIVLMNNFIDNDNTYTRFDELCNSASPEVRVDFEEIKFGIILSTFNEKTFSDPIGVMTDSYTGGATGYMPFDLQNTPDYYEYSRTGLSYYQRLLTLIDSNLKNSGRQSPVVSEALADIQSKRAYANRSFTKWRSIGNCSAKLLKEERKIYTYIYEKEKAYIQQVHQDIKRLRTTDSDREAQAIFDKYKGVASYLFEDLQPLDVHGLDVISKDGYLATQFNFYSRVSHYLKSYRGSVRVRVMLPAEIKKSPFYSYRDLNGNFQTVKPRFIPFQNTVSDFTRFFCDTYFTSLSFTQWYSFDGYVLKMKDFLRSQMTSLSIGNISVADYLSSFKDIVEYFKFSPQEIEILNHLDDRSLFSNSVFDDMFIQMNFQTGVYSKKLGLLDLSYTYLNEDVLGYDFYANDYLSNQDTQIDPGQERSMRGRMPLRRGAQAEGQILHDTLKDPVNTQLLFELDQNIIRGEYAQIKDQLSHRKALVEQFKQAARDEDFSEVRVDLFINESISEPLFSPYILNRYNALENEFHQRTSGCFRADANCF